MKKMYTYQVKVRFSFLDDEHSRDSETFELKGDNVNEVFKKAFEKVINNWEPGSIGITSIDIG